MIVLIVLAAVLAGTAVYLRIRRAPAGGSNAVLVDAAVGDAGGASGMQVVPDAAVIEPKAADAGASAVTDAGASAVGDAGTSAGDAGTGTAAVADAGAAVAASDAGTEDKAAQAKALLEQANDAIQEGAFDRALRAADASIALKKSPRAYLARAKALQRLDRIDDALAAIKAAEQMAPKYPSVFELRGRILWAARRKEEARVQFELFLELEPTGPRAAQIQRLLDEPR